MPPRFVESLGVFQPAGQAGIGTLGKTTGASNVDAKQLFKDQLLRLVGRLSLRLLVAAGAQMLSVTDNGRGRAVMGDR
uniref:Uncharacterized protein n=1 Tax=Bradyrhizobium amphicarpaeae TaxID=1404768 RepID=A0A2U8PZX7_9BRAD|nr:hypothetical protein CIT40_27220 [Bradyrhizobium amphicarpaeae]